MLNDSHSFESVEIRNYQLKRLTSNCKKTKKDGFRKIIPLTLAELLARISLCCKEYNSGWGFI
jgi:hypothetical protein